MTTDTTADVARNLREIERLSSTLLTQAVAKATDRLMPGGLAMVALADISDHEKVARRIDLAEQAAIRLAGGDLKIVGRLMPAIEDDDWEPPLQTLTYWSEQWRSARDLDWEPRSGVARPTIDSEASFLRLSLDWANEHEPRLTAFIEDIATALARLENLLADGDRPVARGVPCMYDECRGARLVRKTVPASDKNGNKIWRLTDWHCPRCKRTWDEESYGRHIYAAIHREKTIIATTEDGTDVWCTVDLAAKRVARPESTIRVWLHREQIRELEVADHPTWRYVHLGDVERRDQEARARWERRMSTILTKIRDLRVAA